MSWSTNYSIFPQLVEVKKQKIELLKYKYVKIVCKFSI